MNEKAPTKRNEKDYKRQIRLRQRDIPDNLQSRDRWQIHIRRQRWKRGEQGQKKQIGHEISPNEWFQVGKTQANTCCVSNFLETFIEVKVTGNLLHLLTEGKERPPIFSTAVLL